MQRDNETRHFRVHCPEAIGAFVIGDFNGWSTTATPMDRTDGDWERAIDLPPGHHQTAIFLLLPVDRQDSDGPSVAGIIANAEHFDC